MMHSFARLEPHRTFFGSLARYIPHQNPFILQRFSPSHPFVILINDQKQFTLDAPVGISIHCSVIKVNLINQRTRKR
jgi:hypothetical protein